MSGERLSESDRFFFAQLAEHGVDYYVAAQAAAGLQVPGLTWPRGIEVHLGAFLDARVRGALAERGLREPAYGTAANDGTLRVYLHVDSAGYFARELARTHSVTLDGLEVRVLSLERIVARDRAERWGGGPTLEDVLAARGVRFERPPSVPGTEVGWVDGGSALSAVEDVLHRAGYDHASHGLAGSYRMDADVDPRSGSQSAYVMVYEDPARPVVEEIHVRLKSST